jgi:hypothetical protein
MPQIIYSDKIQGLVDTIVSTNHTHNYTNHKEQMESLVQAVEGAGIGHADFLINQLLAVKNQGLYSKAGRTFRPEETYAISQAKQELDYIKEGLAHIVEGAVYWHLIESNTKNNTFNRDNFQKGLKSLGYDNNEASKIVETIQSSLDANPELDRGNIGVAFKKGRDEVKALRDAQK